MAKTIHIKGDKALKLKFRRLISSVKNKRTPLKQTGIRLLNEIDNNFKTESHEGDKWQRLKLTTIEGRRKGSGEGTPRILQDTGTLRGSFTSKVSNNTLRVGTAIEYAPTHEEGLGNVPKREMLPSLRNTLEIAIDTTGKYIKRSIKGAGLG